MKQENLYTPDCIRTVSGIYVNIFDPKPEMFIIEDIAHGLSQKCRFSGQLPYFYSVAQHSIRGARDGFSEFALSFLLHDASEAYLPDMASPIKARMPEFKRVENQIMKCIAEKFGFKFPLHVNVKNEDKRQLEWEWQYLMLDGLNFEQDKRSVEASFLAEFKNAV